MDEKTILETSEFVSSPYPGADRRISYRPRERAGKKGRSEKMSGNAKFFLIRLGVCAAIFGTVLALKLSKNDKAIAVIGELTDNKRTDEDNEETRLGKLRFVDLPSIIEVFAPARGAQLPVTAKGYDPDADGGLRLAASSGAEVVSPLDGKVAAVGIDDTLGRYVSIKTDDDREFTLLGLGSAEVEKGQPVSRGQRIGSLAGDTLSVRVYSGGRPVDAAEVFGLGKAS